MNTRIINVREHAEALLAMETDRADAYGSDDVLLYGSRARAKNPDQYTVVGEFLTFDPYAIMIPRNDFGLRDRGRQGDRQDVPRRVFHAGLQEVVRSDRHAAQSAARSGDQAPGAAGLRRRIAARAFGGPR